MDMAKRSDNLVGRQSSSRNMKPYDANNSFVRKMATKVTDFIQPSWISKWFNTSQSNEDILETRGNIEEETQFEDDTQQAPPRKRSCIRMDVIHPPGTFSIQKVKTTLNTVDQSKEYSAHEMSEDFLEPATAGPSGSRLISSTPAMQADVRTITSHRSDLNSLTSSTNNGIANGMDDNSESSESTSGCSSLIPQINRQEGPLNLLYSSFSSRKKHIDDKLTFTNHLQSPRSLFLDNNSRDTLNSRRPSFNASVMTNTLDRASPLSSPFYSGNITFGGANAASLYKRNRNLFNNSSELQLKVPRRTNIEVKASNSAGVDSSGMSQTAKKILEALEHFSSPISDAKKIPLKHTSNTMSSITNRKRAREEIASPSARIGLRPLTRELIVPTVPDILKLKRREKLQDTTVAARKIVSARSDPPPVSQEYRLRTENSENEKFHGKLKGKSKINLEQETVASVNLPNIPLPITTLPNFNFTVPSPAVCTNSTTVASKENTFTFTSPIKVTDTGKNLPSVNNFTFSNPINIKDNANNTTNLNSSLITETKESGSSIDRTAISMPNFIWSASSTAPRLKTKVKNSKDDQVGFAVCEVKSGSVMDVLCPKNAESNLIEQSNSKLTSETCIDKTANMFASSDKSTHDTTSMIMWECNDCLIKNHSTDKQCIACKLIRPNLNKTLPSATMTEKIVPKSNPTVSFGSQFKLSVNQWECTICCVRNKQTDNKCVACSASKPKSQETGNLSIQQIVTATMKPQKSDPVFKLEEMWECSGCLLKNTPNVISCICCNASKSTSLNQNDKKTNVITESSAQKLNIAAENIVTQDVTTSTSDIMNKFKLNKDSWECPGCLVRNNNSVIACPCCNTTKPGSDGGTSKMEQTSTNGFGDKFKKPEGAWNCDSCLLQNDAKHTQCIACQTLKPGTIKSSDSDSNTQFKFGISNASDSTNQPCGFKFGIDKTDQAKSSSNTSTSPLNGFKFGNAPPNSSTTQFTFGILKEENKIANETSKTNIVSSNTGFLFNVKNTENNESAKQNQETKHIASFGIPQNETSTANEKLNTNTSTMLSTTTITPLFTFGTQKSGFNQPASNIETQKICTVTDNFKSTTVTSISTTTIVAAATTTIITTTTSTTTSIASIPISTSIASIPISTTTKLSPLKVPPIFSFGATNNITTVTSNTSTNTTTCLPVFAQPSFTFSDSKATSSQPISTISTFGQIPASSTALSTKLFEGDKISETSNSSSNKFVNVTPASMIFPIVSSSTSLFNSNESKTTTFDMDKPSTFTAASKQSSGFAMSENKIPTFTNNNTENKPTIFGTPETAKLSGFNSSAQTSIANPLPSFGTSSNATSSLFGASNTSTFGNNTFGGITTSTIFSSTKPSETINAVSNPSLFTFGSSSQQQSAGSGFNFSANTTGAKPLFTFGNNASTSQSNNVFGSGTFGVSSNAPTNTANFTFNSTKQETPTAFGQSAVATPIFGAPQVTQTQATSSFSSTSSNAGFNFGSTVPPAASGGFNFGGMSSTSTPGGFNFNPTPTSTTGIAFDPNSRPSFNFTKGSAPTSFNAPPQSAAAPRKIKKAFRRCMR